MRNSFEILAATPPKLFFYNVRLANEHIRLLERQLGIPTNERIKFQMNLLKANRIIGVLKTLIATMKGKGQTSRTGSLALHGREKFKSSVKILNK
jgi:hypothetical protein